MTTKVGALLDQFMVGANIDDTRLSKITKVAKANISRLKNDPKANPTLATLKPLAAFFGITVSQLLGEEPLLYENKTSQVAFRLPILEWEDVQNSLGGQYFGVKNWLSVEYKVSEHAFAVRMNEKTMIPLFPTGAVLIIDKQSSYEDGAHVLVHGSEDKPPFLRQYLIDGDIVFLKSLKIGADWVEPLNKTTNIIGAVIEVRFQMENI